MIEDKQELHTPKTNPTSRMLSLMIEIALVFAVPAFTASMVGPRIDTYVGTEQVWTIALIVTALVLSWTFVIVRYKKARRAYLSQNK